ncbi:LexA/Signal peptidase, partial [Clavulina sp. PMI_390]
AGPSMLPTLRSRNDWLLDDRISHRIHGYESIKRGSLVIYVAPYDRTRIVCKRLVGLPGDVICVDPYPDPPSEFEDKDGDIVTTHSLSTSPRHIVVPEGHFWAQGDNRSFSRDSNSYGPVPFGLLRGQ